MKNYKKYFNDKYAIVNNIVSEYTGFKSNFQELISVVQKNRSSIHEVYYNGKIIGKFAHKAEDVK